MLHQQHISCYCCAAVATARFMQPLLRRSPLLPTPALLPIQGLWGSCTSSLTSAVVMLQCCSSLQPSLPHYQSRGYGGVAPAAPRCICCGSCCAAAAVAHTMLLPLHCSFCAVVFTPAVRGSVSTVHAVAPATQLLCCTLYCNCARPHQHRLQSAAASARSWFPSLIAHCVARLFFFLSQRSACMHRLRRAAVLIVEHLSASVAGTRESLEGGGRGLPPPHCTDSTPKAFPYPNTSPQPHFQPPETASPNRLHIPCDRSATALGLPRWPPSPSSKAMAGTEEQGPRPDRLTLAHPKNKQWPEAFWPGARRLYILVQIFVFSILFCVKYEI